MPQKETLTTFPAPIYNPGDTLEDVLSRIPIAPEVYQAGYFKSGTEKEGYSPIIGNSFRGEKFVSTMHPDINSGFSIFEHYLTKNPDGKFMGYRKFNEKTKKFDPYYSYYTYRQIFDIVHKMGSGIFKLFNGYNLDVEVDIVTIYMPNCCEWIMTDLSCQAYSIATTPLYDTLSASAIKYVFSVTKSPIIVTTKDKVTFVAGMQIPELKCILVKEKLSLSEDYLLFEHCNKAGLYLLDMESLQEIGSMNLSPLRRPQPEDIFTLAFTSGTTGNPKGLLLSQAKLCTAIVTISAGLYLQGPRSRGEELRTFEFLPLAHCFERMLFHSSMLHGCVMHFAHDPKNPLSYFEDIKIVKPSFIATVPTVFQKIEVALKQAIGKSPFLTKMMDYKLDKIAKGEDDSHFIFDNFIRKKLRASVGFDNINFIGSGAAAFPYDTIKYLYAAFGVGLVQGYGSTEMGAAINLSPPQAKYWSSVGGASLTADVRLRDVPDMGYTWKGNRSGELLVKGPAAITEYFHRPDANATAFEDGWYCSGDVVRVDDQFRFFVIDRVKNFFKLAQGKFITSETVQSEYITKNKVIEQIFVYGESSKQFLVSIIGLNPAAMRSYFEEKGLSFDFDALEAEYSQGTKGPATAEFVKKVNMLSLRKTILTDINSHILKELYSYEQIKNVYFDITPFSPADNTLTPTLKLKRAQAKEKYHKQIDAMYKEGNLFKPSKI